MNYISTRDPAKKPYTAAQVIKMGLAPDGGLFLPESIPALTRDEVFALVEFEDASLAKVGARLTKLVDAGKVVKTEVKGVTASGKKTTRMAYALALTDAEPTDNVG